MAVSTRNSIVTNGLVLYLDAANSKSLPAPPSTNLMVWSQDFTQATWQKVRASVTASATTAPDGTLTGTRLVNDTSNNSHYVRSDGYSFTAGETYTVSFYAKAAEQTWVSLQINEANVVFPSTFTDLTNGVLGSVGAGTTATIQSVGNGWYRTTITRTVANTGLSYFGIITATSNGVQSYTGDGVSGVYVWGVQLEKLPYVTPYIPTTTTSVSRNTWSDVSGNGNSGSLILGPTFDSQNGGSIVFDGTNDYCTLGTKNLIQNDFTISIWFKLNSSGDKEHFIFSNNYQTSPALLITATVAGSARELTAYYASGSILSYTISATTNIPASINNITLVRNGSTNIPYLNGIEQTSRIFTNSTVLGSGLYELGYATIRNKTTAYLQGNIYQTSIYNRALSQQEITQNYNALKSRYGLS